MRCFHCNLHIIGKARYVMFQGERLPFHQTSPTFECVNEHFKKEEHQSNDMFVPRSVIGAPK